ncbi:aminotransferase class I/II-fold pyridoxal phosphate-dependent enzyme [Streptomyces tsukubensis]|uniref:GntR family transcriptional regulator n=1 Tax=Streptomyces tsukubensis TaxID=83656 RepID=A0A1V4A6E1_9ACTN|nr:aminotransferase class I/II-fold pyridoxal phosphate-dependent enzyme [Streptomyces tsukubensis]OON77411.1 GntR family transcriptional regulator [Streptomyces tsukubensis]QFR92456.1 aminotransferase class I/II-fold pyridoxal phosphate-dependent enzyme [Streptomyces tsukubensis]
MLGEYPIRGRRAAEIAASVEYAVGAGELDPGQLLPPMRELAQQLDVNPNTVASAYRTLRERGLIETAGRRGSRVRARPVTTARQSFGAEVPAGVRDVSAGNPDPALLPSLADAFAVAAARGDREQVLYGQDAVEPELARLARAAFDADGVAPGPVAVTSGSLDAIERVLAAHLKPQDSVAVEDPGWGSLLDLVPALGFRAVPVRVDGEGPVAHDVERALSQGARALIVTGRAQNPTGATVSGARSAELRAVLGRFPQTLLIEDDHGHGIVDVPLRSLAGATGHWVFVRSTAKAYGPDLRLAVMTGDPVTLDRVQGRQRLGPGWVSRLLQRAVVELWKSGAVNPAEVAGAYARRRDALVAALAERGFEAYGRTGMNVWVPVPDETAAVARLLHAGWAVAPGARFRMSAPPGVRITVSGLTEQDIVAVAEAVASACGTSAARRYG